MVVRQLHDVFWLVAALLLGVLHLPSHAQGADERLAFIVGNSNYPSPASLKNPISDANAMDDQLRRLGFETTSFKDLGSKDVASLRGLMESKIKRHSVVVFYYAGHGMQIDGRNYLLPVDTPLNDAQRAVQNSVYLGDILYAIEKTKPKLAIVILDACRDNPFQSNKASTPIKQGLARVDPPTSTVVFYATRPGGTALDGEGDNGVFTQALLRELSTPSQPLEVILRRVSSSVYKQTKSDQEPWIEGVIREEFIINADLNPPQVLSASIPLPANHNQQTLPQVALVTENTLQHLALDEAYDKLRSVTVGDKATVGTVFACDNLACENYTSWMTHFGSDDTQAKVNSFRQAALKSKMASICEFSLEKKSCITPDLRFPFYGINLIASNKAYTDGFALQNASLSKSGGLKFESAFLGGAVLYVGYKTKSNCQPSESKIDFERDRLNMEVARIKCLNNFTVSFVKTTMNVLLFNHARNELIAELDMSFFGVGFGAVVGGTKNLVRISFS